MQEGDIINPGAEGKVIVAVVKGKARSVLLGERTALNVLTRASGIATEVSKASLRRQRLEPSDGNSTFGSCNMISTRGLIYSLYVYTRPVNL